MLIRTWDAFSDLARLQTDMNRLFESRARRDEPSEGFEQASWQPTVDIYEDPERVVLSADLPGVEQKDVDIRVENGVLTLRGDRKLETKENKDGYQRLERVRGTFRRSFSVPNLIDAEKISAIMKNGVLTLSLPKRAEAQPRQIKVRLDS